MFKVTIYDVREGRPEFAAKLGKCISDYVFRKFCNKLNEQRQALWEVNIENALGRN